MGVVRLGMEWVNWNSEMLFFVVIFRIKLVCSGKIINGVRTLQEQKVSNGATVMALVMACSEEEAKRECSTYDRVHKIRSDAEMLINENDSSNFLSVSSVIDYNEPIRNSLTIANVIQERSCNSLA